MFLEIKKSLVKVLASLPRRVLLLVSVVAVLLVSGVIVYAQHDTYKPSPKATHQASTTVSHTTKPANTAQGSAQVTAPPQAVHASANTAPAATTTSTKNKASTAPTSDNTIHYNNDTPTGEPLGTPTLTWSYDVAYATEDTNYCYYVMAVDVAADNWQGYSIADWKITMTINTENEGTFPYSIDHTFTRGEEQTFTNTFEVLRNPNNDVVTASANITGAVTQQLGDDFLNHYVPTPGAADFNSNCN